MLIFLLTGVNTEPCKGGTVFVGVECKLLSDPTHSQSQGTESSSRNTPATIVDTDDDFSPDWEAVSDDEISPLPV